MTPFKITTTYSLLLFIPISIYYDRFRRIIIFLILLLLLFIFNNNNNNMGHDIHPSFKELCPQVSLIMSLIGF
jgi:hypothetical protein